MEPSGFQQAPQQAYHMNLMRLLPPNLDLNGAGTAASHAKTNQRRNDNNPENQLQSRTALTTGITNSESQGQLAQSNHLSPAEIKKILLMPCVVKDALLALGSVTEANA